MNDERSRLRKGEPQRRALEALDSGPHEPMSIAAVSEWSGLTYDSAKAALSDLASRGEIEKLARGVYRAKQGAAAEPEAAQAKPTPLELARALRDFVDELREADQAAARVPTKPCGFNDLQSIGERWEQHHRLADAYARAMFALVRITDALGDAGPVIVAMAFDGASARTLALAIEGTACPDCGDAAGPNACRYCGRGLCNNCSHLREDPDGTGYVCDTCREEH